MIVWLASYPRSGNTYLRVLLNKVFGEKTSSVYNDPFDIGADDKLTEVVGHQQLPSDFDLVEARQSDQKYFIKTHNLPDETIADEDKVIYLIRDGREVSVSYYHYLRNFGRRGLSLREIVDGRPGYGAWAEHVRAWSTQRPDLLLIKFEDLIRDSEPHVQQIADYLGLQPVATDLPTFEELRGVNARFFRSGRTDSWREMFGDEEQLLFWLKSKDVMQAHGYDALVPEIYSERLADVLRVSFEGLQRSIAHARASQQVLERLTKEGRQLEARVRQLERQLEKRKGELDTVRDRLLEARRERKELRTAVAGLTRLQDAVGKMVRRPAWRAPYRAFRAWRKVSKVHADLREHDGAGGGDNR